MKSLSLESFATFGDLLRYLRQRERLTQRELSIAVGYSESQINRLEHNLRLPEPSVIAAQFIPALHLEDEPATAARLIELAAQVRGEPAPASFTLIRSTQHEVADTATSLQQRHTNLPMQVTSFIGREREIIELTERVKTTRLLTLTGAGGVGKSRLAFEVAAGVLNDFPDGVWLVELASIADPSLVPQTVTTVFDLREQPGRAHTEALIAYLSRKHLLLILDNCEHLIGACADLTEQLLRTCPHLHILATSREMLRAPGETTWRVPSLTTPDAANLPPFEHVLDYEAIQLFLQRAALARPDFVPTPHSARAVVQICHRLDGIPLAIEMAAVQVSALSVDEIAAELDDRFAFLASGSRTALPRHQTLRATLDWSYNLLSPIEQILLTRLSVFAGGWTADAAKAVCSDKSVSKVLPLLLQLVHKSLIVATLHEGQTRYRLLESVREYAVDTLRVRGKCEVEALSDSHLAYFLGMAEETMDFGGRHIEAWLRRLEPEYDNLRVAFAWANARDDHGEMMLRLVGALRTFWSYRGHFVEGMTWVEAALARGSMAPASARARALLAKAILCMEQADVARALSLGEASLALFRETNDRVGTAWSLELLANNLGVFAHDNARAQASAEEVLPLFRELGSLDGVCRALRALGTCAYRSGNHAQAAQLLEEAIAVAQEIENTRDIVVCVDRLYSVNPKRALELCAQELVRFREAGNEEQIAMILEPYGVLLMAEGEYEQAKEVLEESVQCGLRTDGASIHSYAYGFFFTLMALGYTQLALGHIDRAIAWLNQSLKLSREAGAIVFNDVAQFLRASAMIAQGNLVVAASDTHKCLRDCPKSPHQACKRLSMR